MNIREEILFNAYGNTLNEMAAAELAKVIDLIKTGDVDGAARKYIEVGGNPASSGVAKTVNTYLKKNPETDPKSFEAFKSAVTKAAAEKGVKSARPDEYKTGTTGVTRKGEEITVKGLSQQARLQNVLKVIDKQKKEIDKERAILDTGTDENGLRQLAKEIIGDMQHTDLTDEDKNFIAILKAFSTTGENKDKAIDIMHTIIDEGEKVLTALKKRVAAGGMMKPNEQKLLAQAEKYKKIDVLKAQRSLDTDYQKKRLEKLEYADKWNKEHPERYNKPEEK